MLHECFVILIETEKPNNLFTFYLNVSLREKHKKIKSFVLRKKISICSLCKGIKNTQYWFQKNLSHVPMIPKNLLSKIDQISEISMTKLYNTCQDNRKIFLMCEKKKKTIPASPLYNEDFHFTTPSHSFDDDVVNDFPKSHFSSLSADQINSLPQSEISSKRIYSSSSADSFQLFPPYKGPVSRNLEELLIAMFLLSFSLQINLSSILATYHHN